MAIVESAGFRPAAVDDALEAAARTVQEDLCLLRRRDGGWHLDAACVCFPSRWRLGDKFRRPLLEIHGPTPGYADHLDRRVTALLDHLERPVVRRNWFVHPDPALFQPEDPDEDPVVPAGGVRERLHVRSERQTLRRLPSGWVLFTIRVQQEPLGAVVTGADRTGRFLRYLRSAPTTDLAHRGMAPAQVEALVDALA